MRVLSFIPAFLLAASSFVAAVPGPSDAMPSCTIGHDTSLQPIIDIIANATTVIQPLNDQLASCNTSTPDDDTVSGIVVQIDAVVSTTVAQLKAAAKAELYRLDLTNLCSTIYALLTLIATVLSTLVAMLVALAGGASDALHTDVCNLLQSVVNLVGCLEDFEVPSNVNSSGNVLAPLLSFVSSVVSLLLSICASEH